MSEYYYYKENGNLYRFRIERDEEPWNPRTEQDGNIGTMVCFRDYGDKIVDIEKYIDDLLREEVKETTIINYVKKRKTSTILELKYDRHEKEWQLWGIVRRYLNTPSQYRQFVEVPAIIADTDQTVDWLIDNIIEALSIEDKIDLLERKGYYFQTLNVYEHGPACTHFYTGRKSSHFDWQWDCSSLGFIYTTKQKVMDTCGGYYKGDKLIKLTKKNWKEVAEHNLETEVKEYNMYFDGDCYGYRLDKYIPKDDEWEEDVESCWGYYSDKWDDELAREIANDGITGEPFISEAEAEAEMEELRIMAQADTMVCV